MAKPIYETCPSCFGAGASKHGRPCKKCNMSGKVLVKLKPKKVN